MGHVGGERAEGGKSVEVGDLLFESGETGHVTDNHYHIQRTAIALDRLGVDVEIAGVFARQRQRQVFPDNGGLPGDDFAHDALERAGQQR